MRLKQISDKLQEKIRLAKAKERTTLSGRELCVSMRDLRDMATQIGSVDFDVTQELWLQPSNEARVLACLLATPQQITPEVAEEWVHSLESWLVCDLCCNELLWQTPFARTVALDWTEKTPQFVKRAGFSLVSAIATKEDKELPPQIGFYDYSLFSVRKHASDARPYVLQSVTKALRQIGKRSANLYEAAIETAEEIRLQPSQEARWVASSALASLKSSKVQEQFCDMGKVGSSTI